MSEKTTSPLSPNWLTKLYKECGLDTDDAQATAERTWHRLVTRTHRTSSEPRLKKHDIRGAMVADPMVSFHRITGTGLSRLPFYDDEQEALNPVEFTLTMRDAGLPAEVALAFSKVIVEWTDPVSFFEPVWRALGQAGPVVLDELRRLDWSPLRMGLALTLQEGGPTSQREISKPHTQRPLLTDAATSPLFRNPGKRSLCDLPKKD